MERLFQPSSSSEDPCDTSSDLIWAGGEGRAIFKYTPWHSYCFYQICYCVAFLIE
jgi:hypothetical protein